jgi:hypothetical protein
MAETFGPADGAALIALEDHWIDTYLCKGLITVHKQAEAVCSSGAQDLRQLCSSIQAYIVLHRSFLRALPWWLRPEQQGDSYPLRTVPQVQDVLQHEHWPAYRDQVALAKAAAGLSREATADAAAAAAMSAADMAAAPSAAEGAGQGAGEGVSSAVGKQAARSNRHQRQLAAAGSRAWRHFWQQRRRRWRWRRRQQQRRQQKAYGRRGLVSSQPYRAAAIHGAGRR